MSNNIWYVMQRGLVSIHVETDKTVSDVNGWLEQS